MSGRIESSIATRLAWLARPARLANAALDACLPARCVLCMRHGAPPGAMGAALCIDCEVALPGGHAARCPGCALPVASHGRRQGPTGAAPPPMLTGSSRTASPTARFCARCRAVRLDAGVLSDLVLHPSVQTSADPAPVDSLDAALAAIDYVAPVDRLMLAFKRGQPSLAGVLGELAARAALRAFGAPAASHSPPDPHPPNLHVRSRRLPGPAAPDGAAFDPATRAWLDELHPDAVVPMPSGATALAARGFNQSLLLARRVARRLGVPLLDEALRRVREAPAQKSLQAAARAANLAGAFAGQDAVAGRRVLLVDDVMTTGATLREAAWSLKEAGAASVAGLVVARVP